jgi:hypothetical protein
MKFFVPLSSSSFLVPLSLPLKHFFFFLLSHESQQTDFQHSFSLFLSFVTLTELKQQQQQQ